MKSAEILPVTTTPSRRRMVHMTRAQPYEPEATVVESLPPSDDATSRATITRAVKAMFPGGRI